MLAIPQTTIDARTFRATMGQFATGVTVISVPIGDDIHAMTANAFLSVSLDPPLICVSIGQRARMHDLLTLDQAFGVSVLHADQSALSDHFAGRPVAHAPIEWEWMDDVPLLLGAVARIAARVVTIVPAGDHTLYIGQVMSLSQHSGTPLVFHAGAYRALQPACPPDMLRVQATAVHTAS